MKNKLKEMLLQHKPITEQTFDIEAVDGESFEKERESDGHTPESIASLHNVSVQDILDQIEKGIKVEREHTTDEAEARIIAMDHLVELPDYYTRLDKMEEEGEKDLEDVPAEEDSHTIADAIEEAFLIPKNIRMKHNLRKVNKHAKKADAKKAKIDQFQKDNLEVAPSIDKELKANFDKANQSYIENKKGTLARSVKNMNKAASKYEDLFTKKNSKKIDKFLDDPVYRNKMVFKNELAKTGNPELFQAKADERLKQRAEAEAAAKVQAETKAKEVAAKKKVATPAVDNTSEAQKIINRQKEVLKKTKSLLAE